MVLTDLVEQLIEKGTSLALGYSFEAGLLATAVIVLYHGHSLMSFLQTAVNVARIAFFGAAAVVLLMIIGISTGWLSVGALPSLSGLFDVLPAVLGGAGL